ncbi:EcsC family protein [Dyella sp. 2HG41-7]|uniref:EcsC family protein n=1 Tax=Dyella sp. 2HG41-7 TaxID=2883239 RepID=UPI001F3D2C39|nr:EcsC family protein [Dyella sp. 2HG41-7]
MTEPNPIRPSANLPAVVTQDDASNRVTRAILDFISQIPDSKVHTQGDPDVEARRLTQRAAKRAALTAGTLALPPGPLGWLTILPELISIWKIQAQLVSDIAAAYGKHAELGREQMLWCLFRHTSAQAFRDLVVRLGDRLIFRRVSYGVIERIAKQIGVKVTQRALGEGLSRWMPVIGAIGVGGYAYYDTRQVAATAIAMLKSEIGTDEADEEAEIPTQHIRATRLH